MAQYYYCPVCGCVYDEEGLDAPDDIEADDCEEDECDGCGG